MTLSMTTGPSTGDSPQSRGLVDMFTPKLVSMIREGYGFQHLRADAMSGLTVAIVALPLSMAIAIGSGAKPENGLFTSVVGGLLISALGGSRFQIGGPAGAFIVLVATTVARFGLPGLWMATIMAGCLMLAVGYLRLGTYIKYIPHSVTVGFTAGIGVIIFSGEIKDLLGLTLAQEPGPIVPKLAALWEVIGTVNSSAIGLSALCVAMIFGFKRWMPHWPGLLISVTVCTLLAAVLHLPIETIGSRFGGVPRMLPAPSWPDFPISRVPELIPTAIAIALLGSVESLLSAVVADGMTGRRHRSNCELVAQGYANIASALFGGICATGTIARTATNVRAHAYGPVSGILHSLYLLFFMIIAAPLASYIPLAALAAVLATVAWNMIETHQVMAIFRQDRAEAAVFSATFLLTVFRDLTEGIAVGVTFGSMLFMHRMAQLIEVQAHVPSLISDGLEDNGSETGATAEEFDGVVTFKIAGPFFFGTAGVVSSVLDQIGEKPRGYIIDLSGVPLADVSGAQALASFARKSKKEGASIVFVGANRSVLRVLLQSGLTRPLVAYASTIDRARRLTDESSTDN